MITLIGRQHCLDITSITDENEENDYVTLELQTDDSASYTTGITTIIVSDAGICFLCV